MEFGFGLITCERYPGDARSGEEIYAQALDLAEEAERVGFDSVWVSEHHFVDDAYLPSLLPFLAAVAARTRRIRVGTGVVLAPLLEPVRLAEVEPATGTWHSQMLEDPFNVPLEEKGALLMEATRRMQIVKGLAFAEGGIDLFRRRSWLHTTKGSPVGEGGMRADRRKH